MLTKRWTENENMVYAKSKIMKFHRTIDGSRNDVKWGNPDYTFNMQNLKVFHTKFLDFSFYASSYVCV